MLDEHDIPYRYREYKREPLSAEELRSLLDKLGLTAAQVLRRRDRAVRELGLSGDENDDVLIPHMAAHPTMLQRPIGVLADRAVVGRPPDRLLTLGDQASSARD